MLRASLTYFAGAATVTAAVLLTGARTVTFFALGFAACLILLYVAFRLIGRSRVSAWLSVKPEPTEAVTVRKSRPAGNGDTADQARAPRPAVTPINFLDEEVISALVNLQVKRKVAVAAVSEARHSGALDFDGLFRQALAIVRSAA